MKQSAWGPKTGTPGVGGANGAPPQRREGEKRQPKENMGANVTRKPAADGGRPRGVKTDYNDEVSAQPVQECARRCASFPIVAYCYHRTAASRYLAGRGWPAPASPSLRAAGFPQSCFFKVSLRVVTSGQDTETPLRDRTAAYSAWHAARNWACVRERSL